MGHAHHHEPGKPTPCELRKQFKDVTAYWPPMDCQKFSAHSDTYEAQSKYEVNTQTIAFVAIVFNLIQVSLPDNEALSPRPEPKCRSGTLISINTHRGPPLV